MGLAPDALNLAKQLAALKGYFPSHHRPQRQTQSRLKQDSFLDGQ